MHPHPIPCNASTHFSLAVIRSADSLLFPPPYRIKNSSKTTAKRPFMYLFVISNLGRLRSYLLIQEEGVTNRIKVSTSVQHIEVAYNQIVFWLVLKHLWRDIWKALQRLSDGIQAVICVARAVKSTFKVVRPWNGVRIEGIIPFWVSKIAKLESNWVLAKSQWDNLKMKREDIRDSVNHGILSKQSDNLHLCLVELQQSYCGCE